MSPICRIACRVLPDSPSGRPRVRYLTGWRIPAGPTWSGRGNAAQVLELRPGQARACLRELHREGIPARIEETVEV